MKKVRRKFVQAEEQPVPEEVEEEVLPPPPPPEVDVDSYSENLSPDAIARLEARSSTKPDISHLPSAFGPDGYPIFGPGDKLVIERYASFLSGRPYLDTRTYRVVSVDLNSGHLALYDEELLQQATDNWRHGVKIGQQYRIALGRLVNSKGKRGRPKKDVPPPTTPSPVKDNSLGVKKGRGRPKGSKNRDKSMTIS